MTSPATPAPPVPSTSPASRVRPGEVRRRIQQDTLARRERTGDPFYQVQLLLHALAELVTKRRQGKIRSAICRR